jgi:hypothetical protein
MAFNSKVIHQILYQLYLAGPGGIEDETKIEIQGFEVSSEGKRNYLDWFLREGLIDFKVFGASADNLRGIAKNIRITEKGLKRIHRK